MARCLHQLGLPQEQRTAAAQTRERMLPAARGRAIGWLRGMMLLVALVGCQRVCFGSAALLMEEPFGRFGAFNPTGHAAVYLDHICAESPTRLRPCEPGEHGVVISRYHKIQHLDWVAVPLVPYLYAVDRMQDVPAAVTPEQEGELRGAYWREHLQLLAPAMPDGGAPGGEWIQLVGSLYDRKIYGFQVETTPEQDARFIANFNDRRNAGHFNLFFHNCADFSRVVMNTFYPGSVHRSFVADVGLMTPKQAAKSMLQYAHKHPEVGLTTFVMEQVPGTLARSHHVDGVEESLVRSKKYIVPLALLTPHVATAAVVGYLARGRMRLPKDAPVFEIEESTPASPVAAGDLAAAGPPASTE